MSKSLWGLYIDLEINFGSFETAKLAVKILKF